MKRSPLRKCISLCRLSLIAIFMAWSGYADPLHWAILDDGSEQSQRLSELLLVELSENPDLTLVERNALAQISNEQKMAAMSGTIGLGGRIKLLNLIKADRLILLSSHSEKSPPTIRIVIAESAYGARLAAREFPAGSASSHSAEIAALINRTHRHYSRGIEAVIGVAPLTPDNLSHSYDYLSAVYRDLLQGQLAQVPGLAVIEMDEAKAIAREIAIAEGDVKNRITPILVDAHYKVSEDIETVRFRIKATRGNVELLSITETVSIHKVPTFFRQKVSPRLLQKQMRNENVSVDDQFNWLATEAESFSRLALPQRSAGLREAALLLKPKNLNERLSLLADYREIFGSREALPENLKGEQKAAAFNEQLISIVNGYLTSLKHLEYLIMNQMVNREIAADLISQHAAKRLIYAIPYTYQTGFDGVTIERTGAALLRQAEDAEFAMHKLILPVFYELPLPKPNRGLGLANFDLYLMESYLNRIDSSGITPQQLVECTYFFERLCAEDRPTSYRLMHFFSQKQLEENKFATANSNQWRAFLEQSRGSKKALVRALAEYGMIKCELWRLKELNDTEKTTLAKRISALMQSWQALPARRREARHSEPIYKDLSRLHKKLIPPKKDNQPKHTYPTKPDNWQTDPSTWKYWGYPPMLGHLRFKKRPLRMAGADTSESLPKKLRFTKGTASVDFLWNQTGVWQLDPDLLLSPIGKPTTEPIQNVLWDGRYLWTLWGKDYANSGHGVTVYDVTGQQIAELKADQLSPNDVTMRMISIKEGVACITGTFRPHNRTWLALASIVNGKLELKEFHHAREMPTIQKEKRHFGNPNLVFVPTWMHLADMGPNKANLLLIGRDRTTSYERFHPLAVDVTTLKVSVHPYEIGDRGTDKNFYSRNGEIIQDKNFDLTHWARLGEKWETGKEWKHICGNIHNTGHLGDGFFVHDNHLHVTGRKWFRINLKTMTADELTRGVIPDKWRMQWYGSSASHGLIGFNGTLYSITFAEKHLFTQEAPRSHQQQKSAP